MKAEIRILTILFFRIGIVSFGVIMLLIYFEYIMPAPHASQM